MWLQGGLMHPLMLTVPLLVLRDGVSAWWMGWCVGAVQLHPLETRFCSAFRIHSCAWLCKDRLPGVASAQPLSA